MSRRWSGALVLGLLALGCEQDETQRNREYSPDMVDSVPYDSFAPNPNTGDGKTLLAPPKGSIPRGHQPVHFQAGYDEALRAGKELTNPLPATPEGLARGEVAFMRYCTPCHGKGAEGDGLVTVRFPRPPSLLAEHARGLPDGQLFHIITHGQGVMPAHGQQVDPQDRWRIVQYIRRLQGQGGVALQKEVGL